VEVGGSYPEVLGLNPATPEALEMCCCNGSANSPQYLFIYLYVIGPKAGCVYGRIAVIFLWLPKARNRVAIPTQRSHISRDVPKCIELPNKYVAIPINTIHGVYDPFRVCLKLAGLH
jgi:hypothetical protein